MEAYGKSNVILEDVWNHLPTSVTHIGVYRIPLTPSGINIIAEKMTHQVDCIDISYSSTTWESMFSIISEITRRRQLPHLEVWLGDRMSDSVIFGKLLGETKKFRGSLEIGFWRFTLSEAHAEEVLKVIGTTSALKKVTFESTMTVSDPIKKKLKEESRKRDWFTLYRNTETELVFE